MGEIERDEGMDRTYIPLPGGFEVQTKGKGSTFRIYDGENDFRLPVCEQPYLFDILERMARASHEANRELTRQVEQLQAKVDAAEKLIDRWRAVQNPTAAPLYQVYGFCAEILECALTAPPSSAPTDPGRADTGREER